MGKYLPSRSAEGKNIYRPVPPRAKMFIILSRRENLSRRVLPSRPVENLCTRCSVPPTFFYVFMSFFPPSNKLNVPSRPAMILSHCDQPGKKRFWALSRNSVLFFRQNNAQWLMNPRGQPTRRATARVLPGSPRAAACSFCRHHQRGYRRVLRQG